jgi:hypothetical protein
MSYFYRREGRAAALHEYEPRGCRDAAGFAQKALVGCASNVLMVRAKLRIWP